MEVISKRIKYIFEKYYMDVAKERFHILLDSAHKFMSAQTFNCDGYFIDENRLAKAVDSYFLDVIKFKEYHFNNEDFDDIHSEEWIRRIHVDQKINDSKVAAFTAKWLLKSSLIYVKSSIDQPILDDFTCHINEAFALNCVLYTLLGHKYDLLDRDDLDKLFYDFKYRPFDERGYFSRFESLEKNVELKFEQLSTKHSTENE